jgi:glycerol-3-phosphate dehydrogenase subunit B
VLYDCLIIGGGIAGLTCGIRCAAEGLKTAVISGGMNSLHFSSGSIDLAGYDEKGRIIKKPFEYISKVISRDKNHPYASAGIKTIKNSIAFFSSELEAESLPLNNNGDSNHFHVTAIGTLKPSYLSQESIFNEKAVSILKNNSKIAILNFRGFRDYYPEQTIALLKNNSLFQNIQIISGEISLPYYINTEKNLHEFRSVDLARIFETEKYLPRIADEILKVTENAEAVSLPAFLGIKNYSLIRKRLEELTGKYIYEIPSLPPSIPGLRLDNALKNRYIKLGGDYISGDRAESGQYNGNTLEKIITRGSGTSGITAGYFVLATGSFFSGGIVSEFNNIYEPLLGLKVKYDTPGNKWYSTSFFDKKSHPFLGYGVLTDKKLNPINNEGKTIRNLFCAGSVLAGYNPVKEGNGGGVAISTGYSCAERIIKELKK